MSVARITQLIRKKRTGESLTDEEIAFFIKQVVASEKGTQIDAPIEPCQTGAMLMAMYLNGLNEGETRALTHCMKESGFTFSWPEEWRHLVVDKHSTGGVGDKVSLILAPALAAVGLKVPMISGRSLAHTGGTLDKLESIPGFRVELTVTEVAEAVRDIGCCIVSQTVDINPADRVIYRCRDLTATVTNPSLITASIVSKKLAEGVSALVYDVKFGKGSMFKSEDEAMNMAKALVTASSGGIKCSALFTAMDWPIGNQIGNTLEVLESIECLQGKGPEDLIELVEELGGELLLQTGQAESTEEAKVRIRTALNNGSALKKFRDMLLRQGVSVDTVQELCYGDAKCALPKCKTITDVMYLGPSGYVNGIEAVVLANIWKQEMNRTSRPCLATGFTIKKHVGDPIESGEVWLQFHHDQGQLDDLKLKALNEAITVGCQRKETRRRVTKKVTYNEGKIQVSNIPPTE